MSDVKLGKQRLEIDWDTGESTDLDPYIRRLLERLDHLEAANLDLNVENERLHNEAFGRQVRANGGPFSFQSDGIKTGTG